MDEFELDTHGFSDLGARCWDLIEIIWRDVFWSRVSLSKLSSYGDEPGRRIAERYRRKFYELAELGAPLKTPKFKFIVVDEIHKFMTTQVLEPVARDANGLMKPLKGGNLD